MKEKPLFIEKKISFESESDCSFMENVFISLLNNRATVYPYSEDERFSVVSCVCKFSDTELEITFMEE